MPLLLSWDCPLWSSLALHLMSLSLAFGECFVAFSGLLLISVLLKKLSLWIYCQLFSAQWHQVELLSKGGNDCTSHCLFTKNTRFSISCELMMNLTWFFMLKFFPRLKVFLKVSCLSSWLKINLFHSWHFGISKQEKSRCPNYPMT